MASARTRQADTCDRPFASRRRAVIGKASRDAKVDAYLASRPEDVSYLSGFTGDDSLLLFGRAWACLITDGRYAEQAADECAGIEVHVRSGAVARAVAGVLAGRGVRGLALPADEVTLRMHELMSKVIAPRRLKAVGAVVREVRAVKSTAEVAAIRKAVRLAERAFRSLLAGGAKALIGRSERRIAAELDYRMRLAGAEGPAFETIVAAGAHGSLPHHRPGAAKIRRGQAILFDWGAKLGGYCSDLTRVVFIGTIPPKIAEIYELVRRAQAAGIKALRGGAACKSVDSAARRIITRAGFGERFAHGLGHGIGMEVHELPTLAGTVTGRLRAGMVVTVEPGIYLPGAGGVRIEDDVLVTPGGPRRLSSLPRALEAMLLR